MTYALSAFAPVGWVYVTWVFYCAIMALWKAKREGTLTTVQKVLGYPLLFVGYLFDFGSNLIFSLLLLDFPKETLLTLKLKRIQRDDPNGWRNRAAMWVCKNMLNSVDPTGHHC